ncbi:D-alanyl-D-alanine carboxypeptidase [Methylomagnum ishizawai]|uniref:D-alanyl-D-alanine carboxypeptidase n=1 Tax=Methylomagnum ishizawai TaxID=1760988 RepID=A0A1Y6CZK4_9GAMM|nr:D-alanyl-D-alanine carboxypeptidase [Methylomagnum ishizawai]
MPQVAVLRRLIPGLFWAALFLPAAALAGPYAALVADIDTEQVLYEHNADELRHPASLTKMMTLYLVFEALSQGRLFSDTLFRASRFAVLRPPSRLGLKVGDTLSVEEGILGLVTRSANDAASTIAEGMAGSETAFAAAMTDKARQLGMSRTVYRNASGLPDPNQVTTAWDMFRLGKALNKRFPQYYTYFSTPVFYYQGHGFQNHNHLMETYAGMDGIKTGFINASGFNLVASAQRNGHRLIGVVFGGPSARRRDALMRELLDDGFAQLEGADPRLHVVEFDRPAAPALMVAETAAPVPHHAHAAHHPQAHHAAAHPAHPPAQPLRLADASATTHRTASKAEAPAAKKTHASASKAKAEPAPACHKSKCAHH